MRGAGGTDGKIGVGRSCRVRPFVKFDSRTRQERPT